MISIKYLTMQLSLFVFIRNGNLPKCKWEIIKQVVAFGCGVVRMKMIGISVNGHEGWDKDEVLGV